MPFLLRVKNRNDGIPANHNRGNGGVRVLCQPFHMPILGLSHAALFIVAVH